MEGMCNVASTDLLVIKKHEEQQNVSFDFRPSVPN